MIRQFVAYHVSFVDHPIQPRPGHWQALRRRCQAIKITVLTFYMRMAQTELVILFVYSGSMSLFTGEFRGCCFTNQSYLIKHVSGIKRILRYETSNLRKVFPFGKGFPDGVYYNYFFFFRARLFAVV